MIILSTRVTKGLSAVSETVYPRTFYFLLMHMRLRKKKNTRRPFLRASLNVDEGLVAKMQRDAEPGIVHA
jgi:hypothetical protein